MASHLSSPNATYTLTADFDEGSKINVVTTGDEVKLDDTTTPFGYIWIAASGRGAIVKFDTATGAALGERHLAPDGRAKNPSRTTVDANGSVWATNRDESAGGLGSAMHIGLLENGQCVDRNGNPRTPDDGRVCHISFTADDANGGSCSGVVRAGFKPCPFLI